LIVNDANPLKPIGDLTPKGRDIIGQGFGNGTALFMGRRCRIAVTPRLTAIVTHLSVRGDAVRLSAHSAP
jgi:hypothetical protein